MDMVPIAEVLELPDEEELLKAFSVVIDAVNPVALVQAEPMVVFDPVTKLTGAHLDIVSTTQRDITMHSETHLVEDTVWTILDDLDETLLSGKVAWCTQRWETKVADTGL